MRNKLQERGTPHVNLFLWIFNARNIENQAVYTDFIEKE